MTALALNTATRSATFVGAFIDAMNKAIAMARAARHITPTAADMKNVRAIAATI